MFRSDVRLTVPLFQRPYVWSAEEQWLPLWEDVLATRDRLAQGSEATHFLGAVVLVQRPHAHGSLELREVIDGQQRLTTLQLLICAVKDAYARLDLPSKSARRLLKLLENDPDIIDDPDEVFRLWPTNLDREPFRQVLSGQHIDSIETSSPQRIVSAYLWFREAIDDLIERDASDPESVLDSLTAVLLDSLDMVVIDLTDRDNAQIIFETLNARGTPLRPSDLIKNLVFRALDSGGKPIEAMYSTYWQPFEGQEWQEDVRLGRLLRNRLDTFMGFFLVIWLAREVQAHQVFSAARGWIGSDPQRAEEFLTEASRYAVVYRQYETRNAGDIDTDHVLTRMRVVDTQTLTPLVLWIVANTEGQDRVSALLALESYVVRRNLCRLTTQNYNRLFLELLRRLEDGEHPVAEAVTRYLASQTSSSGSWPSDTELERSFVTLPLYKQLKRAGLEQVLRTLERFSTTQRSELIDPDQKLSIEHLMPQKWQDTWDIPEGLDHALVAEEREALIHTIGNLTLVTQPLNSGMQNGPWGMKRPNILAHSALSLNRGLPPYWSEDTIRARSAWLARIAVTVWQRPPLAQDQDDFVDESERDLRPDRDSTPKAETPSRRGPGAGRRDVGAHIAHAFRGLPEGTFLTIQHIRNTPSPEYGDDTPSAGAISARLFPRSGKPTTVPGVRAIYHGGVRGASKL